MGDINIYADSADIYDIFEFKGKSFTDITVQQLTDYFRQFNVKTVLDMSCGTGAQCIPIAQQGFNVTATDLSLAMLAQAKKKAGNTPNLQFKQANMITVSEGEFDCIYSAYNAVAHLSKSQLQETILNAAQHLAPNGILIFDVFSAEAMPFLPRNKVLDTALEMGDTRYVRYTNFNFDITKNAVDICQEYVIQRGFEDIKELMHNYCLQAYHHDELAEMIKQADLKLITLSVEGMKDVFNEDGVCHFVVAQKQ
ncbi:class I SAM-dependent methyltransferase [Alteromonas sp. a30]|uniref:class I SAM-dependent methyltransferase n=1 Tax=Alteromonas sp. a30 TaxID=2730917 RepID=UPI0022828949|nr:class I SAM-dependent methyltransferase [Alteromonas sp. a30]MCY7294929.1 class I SAM-dependent methyltransferase [Alteromonas sp. a30]